MIISIIAHPNSKKPRIEKDLFGGLHVYVNQPPLEGKANKAVAEALAEYFKISKSKVSLMRGRNPNKKFLASMSKSKIFIGIAISFAAGILIASNFYISGPERSIFFWRICAAGFGIAFFGQNKKSASLGAVFVLRGAGSFAAWNIHRAESISRSYWTINNSWKAI